MMIWKARVFEVFEDQKPSEKAVHAIDFTFEASSVDGARAAAGEALVKRKLVGGERKLRSFSHIANEDRTVAIVVSKPRPS